MNIVVVDYPLPFVFYNICYYYYVDKINERNGEFN